MEAVSVVTVIRLLHDAQMEDREQLGMLSSINKQLQPWMETDQVPQFLSQCCSYLFIDQRDHVAAFSFFGMFLHRSRQKTAKQSRLPQVIIHIHGALEADKGGHNDEDDNNNNNNQPKSTRKKELKNKETTRRCTILLAELLFQIAAFMEKWNSHKIKSWRELPASIYRALECCVEPEMWEKLDMKERCIAPIASYHLFHPAFYMEQKETANWVIPPTKRSSRASEQFPTLSEQQTQTATLAALALLQKKLVQPPAVRRTYSLLCHHLAHPDHVSLHNNDDDEEKDETEWLSALAQEIQHPTLQSEYSQLCQFLQSLPLAIALNQRNHIFCYYMRPVQLVEPRDTPIQNLPRELAAFTSLHHRTRGSLCVLRFCEQTCSTLSLHRTMQQLCESYPAANLSSDYVIYRSERFSYLALSKKDYKLIVHCLLPQLRINGHFKSGMLPVFLHVVEGLLQGSKRILHYSLKSVYELVTGWAFSQSYFKTVRSSKLMRTSVRLLASYAGFFEGPAEFLEALTRPYINKEVRELRGNKVHRFVDTCCPQEVIKAIILLDQVHHMRRSDYDNLYRLVCKEQRGKESWDDYDMIFNWIQGTHSKKHSTEIISLRRKPFDFLYSYILESGEFTLAESKELVESIKVRPSRWCSFHTMVPSQAPGLETALQLSQDEQLEQRYERGLGKLIERRNTRNTKMSKVEMDQLCMMLRILEYVRLCSPDITSPDWRGDALTPPTYLSDLAYHELFGEYKTVHGLPIKVTTQGQLLTTYNLFPVFGTHYIAPTVPQRVLHTTDPEFLTAALYSSLPSTAVGAWKQQQQHQKRKRLKTLTQRRRQQKKQKQ